MRNLYLKLAHRWDDIQKCIKGEIPKPLSATIYPSETCNLNCVYCHSKSLHDGGLMTWDVYKAILDDLLDFGIKAVAFEGGGEPMLNPEMPRFISYAVENGLKVGILTNGTIYDDSMLAVDWIRISLDVPDKDVFNELKCPSQKDVYDKILSNILLLVSKKNKQSTRRTPAVGVKYLLSSKWKDRESCKKQARELGVDYCQVKFVRNHDSSLVDNIAKSGARCKLTPLKVVINYDGTYYLCPFFHHQDMRIGNGSIKELWGSEEHRKLILNIDPSKCALYDCPMRNINMDRLKEAHLEWV